jgi:hypothetical protein
MEIVMDPIVQFIATLIVLGIAAWIVIGIAVVVFRILAYLAVVATAVVMTGGVVWLAIQAIGFFAEHAN